MSAGSLSSPVMECASDAALDPEAPWPPAPRARACRLLPWALVAVLLLLVAACAVFLARPWAVSGAHASPGSAASPRLREGPELSPDNPAGLLDLRQVRRAPTLGSWSRGRPLPSLWDSLLPPAPPGTPVLHSRPGRGDSRRLPFSI